MTECVIFGGLLLDKYFEVDELPERGQDGFISREFECVGGCSVNMAVTFNNLGGNAHVVSYIGKDSVGQAILTYMKEHGLSTRYVGEKEGTTGYCLVFLEPDGERTFLTKTGMELGFSRDILSDGLRDIRYAAVTGYFLLNDQAEEIVQVLEEFQQTGGYILFDPSPLVEYIDKELLERLIRISSLLTPNTSEMECIRPWLSAEQVVILKRGQRGGTVYQPSGTFDYLPCKVEAVDTTGAGDSFAAGVLFGIAEGRTLQEAVRLGSETSAITVAINGPHGFWKLEDFYRKR
ncbi:carbohydrate kinase family protein [Aminipila butyrica]|uniref:Carbohydrate kinase family protein n=1 Tax=Aminipila butyrica TaxID=433296 RepID=A0A858BVM8_9FIRM|nr:carbohydrate kinase family protein [Aminipila butyrica]QIB69125.1 carbohydrate kinase family protein [Aminipila butyrica]